MTECKEGGLLVVDTHSDRGDSIQIVKAFVQYYRDENDTGLRFWYLTELQVDEGATIGDLLQMLVNGEISSLSPYGYLPAVHYSMTGRVVYCESMPCMLTHIQNEKPESFMISYREPKGTPRPREAELSNQLSTGDVLLFTKKPSGRPGELSFLIMTPAALNIMMDEEKKGLTKKF
ncbi:MAG: hypothetical protein ACFFER_19410 [Candidatus Thorarchaeota archaeon]